METTATDFVGLKKNLGSKLPEVVIPNISTARTEVKAVFNVQLFKMIGWVTSLGEKEDKPIYNSML